MTMTPSSVLAFFGLASHLDRMLLCLLLPTCL
uniref:Uncharacterized protein n=1 Tax=Arundo donax TaxID=35708 RepID=A0A0A8Z6R1_ARUDO